MSFTQQLPQHSHRMWMGKIVLLGLTAVAVCVCAVLLTWGWWSVPNGTAETSASSGEGLPLVINTWPFTNATDMAYHVITSNGSPLDAVQKGCNVCELEQCDGSVGFGSHPDESGEVTLDAMIMDGPTHVVGSVGCLKQVKEAISVARAVMERTNETLLVGSDATKFAKQMGFPLTNLSTAHSMEQWRSWKENHCQPNYWKNVLPNPRNSCGPYHIPNESKRSAPFLEKTKGSIHVTEDNHDTIGMCVVDANGDMAVGTSTNGANHKIDGRVGDSPIAGAGAYVDNDVGAAAATGDGDVMMRFLCTYQTVENMRMGMSPTKAAENALQRITDKVGRFSGAIVATSKSGQVGAASCNFNFRYSLRRMGMNATQVIHVPNMPSCVSST